MMTIDREQKQYIVGKLIGCGMLSKVYSGLSNNGEIIAIKNINFGDNENAKKENFEKFQKFSKIVENKNLLKFIGVEIKNDLKGNSNYFISSFRSKYSL